MRSFLLSPSANLNIEGVRRFLSGTESSELIKCSRSDTTDLISKQAQAIDVVLSFEHGLLNISDRDFGHKAENKLGLKVVPKETGYWLARK